MIVKRVSLLSGKTTVMDLDVTEEQLDTWRDGELIQNALPHLSRIEREFLISGMNKEEQDYLFGTDE